MFFGGPSNLEPEKTGLVRDAELLETGSQVLGTVDIEDQSSEVLQRIEWARGSGPIEPHIVPVRR